MNEKSTINELYETFDKLFKVYPQFFPADSFSYELFKWAFSFVCQRCFGFGIGTCALVPMADMLNDNIPEKSTFGLFHKELHLNENNNYLYEKNFDNKFGFGDEKLTIEEKLYQIHTSKARINVAKLF